MNKTTSGASSIRKCLSVLDCFTAPCAAGCPIHQDVPADLRAMEEGKTPLLLKLALLSGFKEEEICIASKKIIKNVLGNEIYKMFNF